MLLNFSSFLNFLLQSDRCHPQPPVFKMNQQTKSLPGADDIVPKSARPANMSSMLTLLQITDSGKVIIIIHYWIWIGTVQHPLVGVNRTGFGASV